MTFPAQWCSLALTASLTALFCTPAVAEVYKCIAPDGKVQFSDSPCEGNVTEVKLNIRTNSLNSVEDRAAALTTENRRLLDENWRQRNDTLREKLAAPAEGPADSNGRTQADAQVQLGTSAGCARSKRDYETSASSIQPNRQLLDALAASMRAACGMREPDKTENTTIVNTGDQRPRRTSTYSPVSGTH